MKSIEITKYPYQQTSEISQLIQYKYAFMSKENKQCHTLVKCRDFLQDAVRNQLFGRKDGIYGFCYKPGIDPEIDVEQMRMLVVQWGDSDYPKFHKEMEQALLILHLFEKDAKIKPLSKVFEVKNYGKPAVVFISHKDWIMSPFLISLHTFLVRLAARGYSFSTLDDLKKCIAADTHKGGSDNDYGYLQITGKHLHRILPARQHLMFNPNAGGNRFDQGSIDEFHNHTGIVSLIKKAVYDTTLKQVIETEILK